MGFSSESRNNEDGPCPPAALAPPFYQLRPPPPAAAPPEPPLPALRPTCNPKTYTHIYLHSKNLFIKNSLNFGKKFNKEQLFLG